MKTLAKIIIGFVLFVNSHAQSLEGTIFKFVIEGNAKCKLNLNQNVLARNGLNIVVKPQFGNLFMTRTEANKAGINLKDYYNDFDFGVNIDLNHRFKENINLKAIYNIGMLKFNKSDTIKAVSCLLKISINYVF